MAEYIEKETAIRALLNDAPEQVGYSREDAADCIRYMDAADVAQVRHGRWMNANSRPKTYWRRCTACGGLAYFCGIGCSYKYCPNCGARMDGGADNGC